MCILCKGKSRSKKLGGVRHYGKLSKSHSGKKLLQVRLKACWLPTEGPALGERKVMKRDRSQSVVGGTWVFTLTRGYLACYPFSVSQVSPLSHRGDGCYHLSRGPRTKQGLVIIQRRGDQTQEPFSVLKSGAGQADPWFRESTEQHVEDGLSPCPPGKKMFLTPPPPPSLTCWRLRILTVLVLLEAAIYSGSTMCTLRVCVSCQRQGQGGGNHGLRNCLASVSGMELKTSFVFVGSESLCLVVCPCPIV